MCGTCSRHEYRWNTAAQETINITCDKTGELSIDPELCSDLIGRSNHAHFFNRSITPVEFMSVPALAYLQGGASYLSFYQCLDMTDCLG